MVKRKLEKTKIVLNKEIYELKEEKEQLEERIKEVQSNKQLLNQEKMDLINKVEQTKSQF